jgi:hypothetical protein
MAIDFPFERDELNELKVVFLIHATFVERDKIGVFALGCLVYWFWRRKTLEV